MEGRSRLIDHGLKTFFPSCVHHTIPFPHYAATPYFQSLFLQFPVPIHPFVSNSHVPFILPCVCTCKSAVRTLVSTSMEPTNYADDGNSHIELNENLIG